MEQFTFCYPTRRGTVQPPTNHVRPPTNRTDLLIAEMQDGIRALEEANRENRRIIAALTQRIPEIEAPASPEREPPQEPREAPAEATEQPGRVGPQAEVEGPSEAEDAERPWWRRMFGG